jgi:hypothetical protein
MSVIYLDFEEVESAIYRFVVRYTCWYIPYLVSVKF